MESRKNKTIQDMITLFGQRENERQSRWANQRRLFVQKLIASNLKELVLENNYIKGEQKIHYMYSLRVYEWRLNDSRLVGNFN